jgi:hypothetical protein
MDNSKLRECLKTIDEAVRFLNSSKRKPRILLKISRNLGDSLESQPIIRHYKIKYPDCCLAFLTEQRYHNAHEYNKDIDGLFLLPNELDPQTRLALWDPIKTNKNIDISIIPSINPFQATHPENKWLNPHPNIVDQFLYNAGIDSKPLGGREIIIEPDNDDKLWADNFLKKHQGSDFIAIEYNSYSAVMAWKIATYSQFVTMAVKKGFKCISIAGTHENMIPGTIDMRGASWRRTVAVLSKVKYFIGCTSGNTILALASRPQPTIIELNPPDDCAAAGTGFVKGKCFTINKPTPANVLDLLT